MPEKAKGFTSQEGTVDIQAPGGEYAWMGTCVSAGPVTVPHGGITRSKCQDPDDPYGFTVFNTFRGAPDDPSFDLMMPKHKTRMLSRMLILCAHNIRKRWSKCLQPPNLDSWQFIEDFLVVHSEQTVDSGGTIEIDGTGADVLETDAMKALCVDYLWRIVPAQVGEGITILDINAVRWCSPHSCGECTPVSDGCTIFKSVTDSGPGYLDTPNLIVATRAGFSWAFAYVVNPITPWSAGGEHAVDLACLSNGRVIIVSTVAGSLVYTDDDVNFIEIPLTVGGEPTAIYNHGWTSIFIVGLGGYIYRSRNGGITWEAVDEGATLTEDLNDVHAYADTVAVVGNDNDFAVSRDGGDVFDAQVGPAGAGIALNVVRVLSDNEILVGTDDGRIFRSMDTGNTWDEVVDFAAILGAAASVDAWDFCGCMDDKAPVILVSSGGTGYAFRTIDHVMTFDRLRDDAQVKQPLPTNLGVNDVACCDPNIAIVVGENDGASGYMALVK